MSTTTLRSPSASPLASAGVPTARLRAAGIRAASTASGDSEALLDLRDDPVRRIEELRVDLVPPADVADGEELRPRRELLRVLVRNVHVHGPEPVLRPDRLRLGRVQPLDELLRLGLVRAVDCGNRRLDLQRRLRDEIEDRLSRRLCELRVALVVEQHVALPRQEGVERVAAARVLRDVVVEELVQVRARLRRPLV